MTVDRLTINEYALKGAQANAPDLTGWNGSRCRNNQVQLAPCSEIGLKANCSWWKYEQTDERRLDFRRG